MGERGPIPKRTEVRRRRNAPEDGVTPTTVDATEVAPDIDPNSPEARRARGLPIPEVDPHWHEIPKMLWESLQYSQQSIFMEPTDWATAYLLCESIDRDLAEQVVGITETGEVVRAEIPLKGASLAAYLKGFASLGMTEGDRRRMRIELKPRLAPGQTAKVRDIKSARKNRVG